MREMKEENRKEMLAGLFLAKFDEEGLRALGFTTWKEAYNAFALAVNGRPLSVKGYRDEFDPFFPNPRKGWCKRPAHQNRIDMMNEYADLGLEAFAELVRAQFATVGDDLDLEIGKAVAEAGVVQDDETPFAKRMVTGQAAENYFVQHYQEYERFASCALERTTSFGCGFDFKLTPPDEPFLGVEVKGLVKRSGKILLTEKEFKMATHLRRRFFLYVVTDFASKPKPQVIENPLAAGIAFEEKTVNSVQRVWEAKIAAA
ncbi:MAG: DUF3883 domain-containing protein [Kiritimatiellae bacterium]|nr:DUF3883 domain-containing protein [Kiritimatiellia bacterium]